MIEIRLKKLEGGYASLPSCDVYRHIKTGNAVSLLYGGQSMTLTPELLWRKAQPRNPKIFTSHINGEKYRLLDYKFVPDFVSDFKKEFALNPTF